MLTNAGGLGILCADACDAAGLELPELTAETRHALAAILPSEASVANPVDLLGSATGETYAQALPHLLHDPGIDAVIVLFVPPVVAGADEVAAAIREVLVREMPGKPVLGVVVSADGTPETLRETGSPVATFAYPESAARALGIAAERIGGPLLVQPMIAGGIELLVGVVQDAVFGPLVAFGPGGVFAELIGGAGFRIAPLTDLDADELVQGGKAGRLVRGFRGAPPADADALVALVHRLSLLAVDLPEVAELDLNPVLALASGCVAVDARVRLQARHRDRSLKSW